MNDKTRGIDSVGVVILKDGKILLVREEEASQKLTGMYGLPAGKVEPGEPLKKTAKRELEEETGLVAELNDVKEFDGNYFEAEVDLKKLGHKYFFWTVFKVGKFSGELRPSDATTPGWYSMEELEDLDREGKLLPNNLAAVKNSIS